MFGYGHPANYQPGQTQAPLIPPARLAAAHAAGAQYISADGAQIWTRRFNKWLLAHWNSSSFGAWLEVEEYPEGAVRL